MAIETFHIATFNAENLLHPGVFFAGRDRNKDRAYTQAEYDEKVAWITRILREGKAGLVGFQEQFSEVALKDVAERAGLPHVYAPDLKDGKNIRVVDNAEEATGPFVALASRFEIVEATSIANFPDGTRKIKLLADEAGTVVQLPLERFQRPVIRAEVQLKKGVVATVFVAHLKSKRPQYLSPEEERAAKTNLLLSAIANARSLVIRAAEAAALRQLVLEALVDNSKPVILFGDLNDDLGAVSTQMIAGEQPFPGAQNEDALRDRLLYSVHDLEMAESYRDVSYTHLFDGRYQLLDHIFVSQEFYERNPKRVATVRSTRIFNDHLVDSRRSLRDGKGPSVRSDHGVPVTEIWWR